MKRRTIDKTIARKITKFKKVIENTDEQLAKDFEDGVIVTGGCIASMFLKEDVNDYDMYFASKDLALRMTNFVLKNLVPEKHAGEFEGIEVRETRDGVAIFVQSAGVAGAEGDTEYEYFEMYGANSNSPAEAYMEEKTNLYDREKGDFQVLFASANAITLEDRVQLIIRFAGEPEEIHDNYDFVHCTGYWTKDTGVVISAEALEALLTRELIYTGSKFPICSMIRLRKFVSRGWKVTAGQMLKIAWQINELNLNDVAVLEDQLTGVDTAYFHEIIRLLREGKNSGDKIDNTYVAHIIDQVFG